MTDATPVADWISEIGTVLTHEALIRGLRDGSIKVATIVDGATDILVLSFPAGEWRAEPTIFRNKLPVHVGRWIPEGIKFVPVAEFAWTDDRSWHRTVTCMNHPSAKYYTKNFYYQGLHFIATPNGFPLGKECDCSVASFAVVCNADGVAVGKPADAEPVTEKDVPPLPNINTNMQRWSSNG